MKKLNITWRLTLTMTVLTAILIAIVALALLQMATMRRQTEALTGRWLSSVTMVQSINAKAIELRALQLQHVLTFDSVVKAALEKSMAKNQVEIDEASSAYKRLLIGSEEEGLIASFESSWAKFRKMHDEVISVSRDNSKNTARELLDDPMTLGSYADTSAALTRLVELNQAGAHQAGLVSEKAYITARNTMWAFASCALLLAIGAAYWLVRSITIPLRSAVQAADRIASGDLTGSIDASAEDETGQVLFALSLMQKSLVQTACSVRDSADGVATASSQIASGNLDLSQRTEEQASALEQTSSTMQQLGATVQHNVNSAIQAKELAIGASSVATQGGEVVGKVVKTMKGINDSSKRIGDIIGVIDGIAFQTNILALNAAVEAARAGEQGRGFAVVASEVRNLAQRSAEAAKQIKTLITNSVDQVEAGTLLVDQAGKTMDQIVESIRGVNEIVSEISAANLTQSESVLAVSDALKRMDSTTQQNAALVEESAAAAESLKIQAQGLVRAVAVFKIVS